MNIKAIKYGRIKRQAPDVELINITADSVKLKFIEAMADNSAPQPEEPHKPKNYDLAMRVLQARGCR